MNPRPTFRQRLRRIALMLGLIATPLAQAETLVVGQVAELSGAEVVAENVAGARLWFEHINKVPGEPHKYVLRQYDDQRDPKLTLELTRKLVASDNAIALFGYRSTPSLNALAKELDSWNIPLVAPFNGSSTVRSAARNVFFLRGTYKDEARRLVDQLVAVGIRSVALVYQQDPFGQEGLEGYRDALKSRGVQAQVELGYDRKTMDVSAVVEGLRKQAPTAALMACTPKACADIIRGVHQTHPSMQMGVLSNAVNNEFIKAVGEYSRGVMMSQVIPYPWNLAAPIVRDFNRLNAAAGHAVPVSYASLEGFAAARLLTEAVRRSGGKPSREGVIAALRAMKNVDLGGLYFNADGKHYFTEVTTLRSDGKIIR